MQKTADAMRISDWISDVCSSDLAARGRTAPSVAGRRALLDRIDGATFHHRACAGERVHEADPGLTEFGWFPEWWDRSGGQTLGRSHHLLEPHVRAIRSGMSLLQIGRASCRERVCQYV